MNKKSLVNGLKPSKIRELYEFANHKKEEIGSSNVYDFSIGNPSAKMPQKLKDALIKVALDDNAHSYTSSAGLIKTRNAIADNLNHRFNSNFSGKYLYLTCGASSSLAICFNAILEEGDEVIIFTPYFPEYRVLIEHANGVVKEVKPNFDNFYPDFNDLENKISDKTKIVLIDSPNNPTGVTYKEEVFIKLADLLTKKQKEYGHAIYLLSDEPYRELIYEGEPHHMVTNYYDNSLICYSFSKSLSIPGDRFGYIAVGDKCFDKDNMMAAFLGSARYLGYVCAPRVMQETIVDVLDEQIDLDFYIKNRDILYNGLREIGYEVVNSTGAFYLFMKALEEDANKFVEKAKEYNLIFVPSDSFGLKGYVRIAYCAPYEIVKNSLPAFKKLFDSYKER